MKADLHQDSAKVPTGYQSSRDHDHDDEGQEITIVTVRDILNKLVQSLAVEGYQLIASAAGRFCNFDVYRRAPLDIEGLNQPRGFCYYKRITSADTINTVNFLSTLKECCISMMEATDSKDERRKIAEIACAFHDKAAEPRSIVAEIARAIIGQTSPVTTLTGKSGYHKVVPPLSWFPEKLQAYDPSDLLTLLPAAERHQLILILGKAVAGAKHAKVAEGTLDHNSRAYGIIVGTEAGMGKSTLLGYLQRTLIKLGYTTAQINPNLTKFGWGEIATADLSTIDDLTEDLQKALLTSPLIKSIVSNDRLKVEEKGIAAYDVDAATTILGCTNLSSYAHFFGMDTGSISRLNQLDTYTNRELRQAYPGVKDAKIKPYWEAKAKEFECNEELLMARLLRHCLDLFLSLCGHYFDESGLLCKDSSKDTLEQATKENRENFRIDVCLKHADELPYCIGHLTALAIARANQNERKDLLSNLKYADFSPDILMVLIHLFCDTPKVDPAFAACYPQFISHDCKRYLKDKLSDIKNLSATQSIDKAFSTVVGELKSNKGFGYPQRSSHYHGEWTAIKRTIPDLVDEYAAVLENTKLCNALKSACSSIETHLNRIVE